MPLAIRSFAALAIVVFPALAQKKAEITETGKLRLHAHVGAGDITLI
jgi:hypothetical protein